MAEPCCRNQRREQNMVEDEKDEVRRWKRWKADESENREETRVGNKINSFIMLYTIECSLVIFSKYKCKMFLFFLKYLKFKYFLRTNFYQLPNDRKNFSREHTAFFKVRWGALIRNNYHPWMINIDQLFDNEQDVFSSSANFLYHGYMKAT